MAAVKGPRRLNLLAEELRKIDRLEAQVHVLEVANPPPFPAPGAVCRCQVGHRGPLGGPARDCRLAVVTPLARVQMPCSCWCHLESRAELT